MVIHGIENFIDFINIDFHHPYPCSNATYMEETRNIFSTEEIRTHLTLYGMMSGYTNRGCANTKFSFPCFPRQKFYSRLLLPIYHFSEDIGKSIN